MTRHELFIGGALVGLAVVLALVANRQAADAQTADAGSSATDAGGSDPVSSAVDSVTEVAYDVGNYFIPVGYSMDNNNVQAFLMLIRTGEGTADQGGYARLFGGASFGSFADHPRQTVKSGGYTSTAAGAYQILSKTWDDLRASGLSLPDFSPVNQDKAAVALIKRRGALADVMAGRFKQAIDKTNKEWASLPGSPYGQPTLSYQRAFAVLAQYGGDNTGSVFA